MCVFNIVRQEFGTAGHWQILHPHEWVKKVQPFIREDCNLMGRVHTWTERAGRKMKTEGGKRWGQGERKKREGGRERGRKGERDRGRQRSD